VEKKFEDDNVTRYTTPLFMIIMGVTMMSLIFKQAVGPSVLQTGPSAFEL